MIEKYSIEDFIKYAIRTFEYTINVIQTISTYEFLDNLIDMLLCEDIEQINCFLSGSNSPISEHTLKYYMDHLQTSLKNKCDEVLDDA